MGHSNHFTSLITHRAIKHLDKKKNIFTVSFSKKSKFCISTHFFTQFLFKFKFLAYECTFISAIYIIYTIGCLKQTGKKECTYLDNKYFLHFFKNAWKFNFMKKGHEKYIWSMGHAHAYHFRKPYIVCYRIRQKYKIFTVSFPCKTMLKLKIPQNLRNPNKQTTPIPHLLQPK